MSVIVEMLGSKKFVAGIVGVLVAGAARIGWHLDVDAIMAILSPLIAAILGQGVADLGKERAQIEGVNAMIAAESGPLSYQAGSIRTGDVSGGSVGGGQPHA